MHRDRVINSQFASIFYVRAPSFKVRRNLMLILLFPCAKHKRFHRETEWNMHINKQPCTASPLAHDPDESHKHQPTKQHLPSHKSSARAAPRRRRTRRRAGSWRSRSRGRRRRTRCCGTGNADRELHAAGTVAGSAADEVPAAGLGETDPGALVSVRLDGVAGGASVEVGLADLRQAVLRTVLEN